MTNSNLSIIQRVQDLLLWMLPRLSNLPRDRRYGLGLRIESTLYDLLEYLIEARYAGQGIEALDRANARLELLRCQVRLLTDLELLDQRRFQHVSGLINEIGVELGAWRRYRKDRERSDETAKQPVAADRGVGQSGARAPSRPRREALQGECPFV